MDESEDDCIVNQSTDTGYYLPDDSDLIDIGSSHITIPPSSVDIIDVDNCSFNEEPSEFVKDDTIEKESLVIISPEDDV